MNSTKALLATTDSQLKYCPPRLHDLRVISADYTQLHVLHNFATVLVDGWPQAFRVLRVWASDPEETYAMSVVFSVS